MISINVGTELLNYVRDANIVSHILKVLGRGFEEADPYRRVSEHVERVGDLVRIGGYEYKAGKIHVIGFGKASVKMLRAVCDKIDGLIQGGIVINPVETDVICNVEVLKGDHPVPSDNTSLSTRKLLEYVSKNTREGDLTIVLISGGGSALFEAPVEGLSLDEIGLVSKLLMVNGADIYELNTVRKHLSMVKGGKLLRYIKGEVVSLIISDVVGDDLSVIASGPTSPDPSTFQEVYSILLKRGVWNQTPESVKNYVVKGLNGEVPETPKPGDPVFEKVRNIIVASNIISLKAMAEEAVKLGYNPMIITPYITGEAREVGKVIASIIKSVINHDLPVKKPAALIAGGETTVTVKGKGIGGRNQELCLSISIETRRVDKDFIVACVGSDGIDGISPAAGAILPSRLFNVALKKGLNPVEYLENNDSYTFFNKLGLAVVTGYTGTNVNDFIVALIP